jgi:hypothetical protein
MQERQKMGEKLEIPCFEERNILSGELQHILLEFRVRVTSWRSKKI